MEQNLTIDILELERLAYHQHFEKFYSSSISVLETIEANGSLHDADDNAYLLKLYTRLASAFTAFFTNPKMSLTADGFKLYGRYKRHLLNIFELSAFGGTDHLISLIGSYDESNGSKFLLKNEQQMMRFLLLYSLYSEIDIDFPALIKKMPERAFLVYLDLLAEECVLSPLAAKKRENLLQVSSLLENITLKHTNVLSRLMNVWMFCSYSEVKNKHDIKLHLNNILKKFMVNQGISTPSLPLSRKIKKRPVILIPLEDFGSNHAMYRCYAPSIIQLRKSFELVSLSEKEYIDDNSKQLFDKVLYVDMNRESIKKLIGKIIKLKPDMIYFPSLGMSEWTLYLANLRLAPIQFMTLGHPATSKSAFIDYIVMQDILYSSEQDCFTEKLILLDDKEAFIHTPAHEQINLNPEIQKNPELIRIVVTSTTLKLNASFMATCKEIIDNSHRPLEFHFFPYEHGMDLQRIKQRIQEWIPNAKVYPGTDYNTYIANINKCDIHLSPFPFGGTNSNIDSMQQGIPIVALEGHEPHSRTDSLFFALGNLPDWLLTHSKEEYITAALRLIHNDEERVAISEDLLTLDFEKVFMDHESHPHDNVFTNSVEWLYQHHEAIENDNRKVWTVAAQKEWD